MMRGMAEPGRWDRGEQLSEEEWRVPLAGFQALGASSHDVALGLEQLIADIRRSADELLAVHG